MPGRCRAPYARGLAPFARGQEPLLQSWSFLLNGDSPAPGHGEVARAMPGWGSNPTGGRLARQTTSCRRIPARIGGYAEGLPGYMDADQGVSGCGEER